MWTHECPRDPRRETPYAAGMLIVSNPEGEPCDLCGMAPPPATDPRTQAAVDLYAGRHWFMAGANSGEEDAQPPSPPKRKEFTETSIKRGRFTFRKRVRVNE